MMWRRPTVPVPSAESARLGPASPALALSDSGWQRLWRHGPARTGARASQPETAAGPAGLGDQTQAPSRTGTPRPGGPAVTVLAPGAASRAVRPYRVTQLAGPAAVTDAGRHHAGHRGTVRVRHTDVTVLRRRLRLP
jgi:hypothetical protein